MNVLRRFGIRAVSSCRVVHRAGGCGRKVVGRITYGCTKRRASGVLMGSAAQFITDIATGVYDGIVDAIVEQIVGVLTSGSAA